VADMLTVKIGASFFGGAIPVKVIVKAYPYTDTPTSQILKTVVDSEGHQFDIGRLHREVSKQEITDNAGFIDAVVPDPRDNAWIPTDFGIRFRLELPGSRAVEVKFGPTEVAAHATGGVLYLSDVADLDPVAVSARIHAYPDATGAVAGKFAETDGAGGWALVDAPSGGGGTTVDASTTVKGIVELATNSEATTGTDTVRAVTPAGLKAAVDALIAGAPGALDTLAEIATQLSTDESAVSALTTTVGGKLAKASNLSDLANAGTARTNLGLGTAATQATTAFEPAGAVAAEATARNTAITTAINNLVAGAPGALDTLLELANAETADATAITNLLSAVAGKQALQQVAATVSASGAAVVNKHNPVDATAAARSLSLPTGQAEGTQVSVEKVDSSVNTVSITGSIRGVGSSTISLSYLSESLMLRADSAGSWWPIAGHRTKTTLDTAYYAKAAPSYAGVRSQPFDPMVNIYGSTTARAKVRRALGFTLGTAKTSLVNILVNGDSFSSGWKATTIGGAGQNEIQTVTITGAPTGGTFTLTFSGQTTSALAFNATAATVASALVALSNIGTGNVTVNGAAGGPYTVMFTGTLATTDVAALTATPSLTGGTTPSVTIATTVGGVASAPGDDWGTDLIGLFREAGYPITGGWVFAGIGNNPGDGRWAFSSGWTSNDTGSNYAFTSSGTGRTATYTSNTTGTVLEVAWFLNTGTSVTWSLDGGAQTGTLSSASVTAPTILTLTGLANTTHTITFTLPTGATYWVIAGRVRATTGLSISNASIYGSHTTDWLPTAKPGSTVLNPYTVCLSVMGGNTPKLILFALGGNDMQHTGFTLSAAKANLNTIIGGWQTAGIPVMQRLYPYLTTAGLAAAQASSPLALGTTWDQYLSAVYDVSDTNDTTLVDHSTVLGDSNTLVSGGLMFSDNLHLLPAGQAAIARADWRAIHAV
jgi:lysophospholipase L1-like esterase